MKKPACIFMLLLSLIAQANPQMIQLDLEIEKIEKSLIALRGSNFQNPFLPSSFRRLSDNQIRNQEKLLNAFRQRRAELATTNDSSNSVDDPTRQIPSMSKNEEVVQLKARSIELTEQINQMLEQDVQMVDWTADKIGIRKKQFLALVTELNDLVKKIKIFESYESKPKVITSLDLRNLYRVRDEAKAEIESILEKDKNDGTHKWTSDRLQARHAEVLAKIEVLNFLNLKVSEWEAASSVEIRNSKDLQPQMSCHSGSCRIDFSKSKYGDEISKLYRQVDSIQLIQQQISTAQNQEDFLKSVIEAAQFMRQKEMSQDQMTRNLQSSILTDAIGTVTRNKASQALGAIAQLAFNEHLVRYGLDTNSLLTSSARSIDLKNVHVDILTKFQVFALFTISYDLIGGTHPESQLLKVAAIESGAEYFESLQNHKVPLNHHEAFMRKIKGSIDPKNAQEIFAQSRDLAIQRIRYSPNSHDSFFVQAYGDGLATQRRLWAMHMGALVLANGLVAVLPIDNLLLQVISYSVTNAALSPFLLKRGAPLKALFDGFRKRIELNRLDTTSRGLEALVCRKVVSPGSN
jgi:hypothetical protein